MNLNNDKVVVINTTLRTYLHALATYAVFDITGKKIAERTIITNINANALTNVFAEEKLVPTGNYLVRIRLAESNGTLLSQNDYWKRAGETADFRAFNKIASVSLSALMEEKTAGKKTNVRFKLTNLSTAPAIGIKLNVKNKLNGELILPAYFSEGYFNLLPGETKEITVEYPLVDTPIEIISEGYNVKPAGLLEFAKN